MIKICSLDLINKETFEADILTADGRVLYHATDKITPDKILKLYFKDIYINKPSIDEIIPKPIKKEVIIEEKEAELIKQINEVSPAIINDAKDESGVFNKITKLTSNDLLEFDEQEAKFVAESSIKIAKMLAFSSSEIEKLEKAAYYHNIGRTRFKQSDLSRKEFRKDQALAGYDILLNEKGLPQKIAETAKLYINKYDSSSFSLNEPIPYYHIVAIANYYYSSIKKGDSREKVLAKMLKIGGNKFNIFVLHKFINLMREENE